MPIEAISVAIRLPILFVKMLAPHTRAFRIEDRLCQPARGPDIAEDLDRISFGVLRRLRLHVV